MARFAGFLARRRWLVLCVAVGWVGVAGALGGPVAGLLSSSSSSFESAGMPSVQAEDHIQRAAGYQPGDGVVAVVRIPGGINSSAARTRVAEVAGQLQRDPAVAMTATFFTTRNTAFVSRDGRMTLVAASLKPLASRQQNSVATRIEKRFKGAPDVTLGGQLIAAEQISHQVEADLVHAEILAFPLLVVVALVIFGSAVAALLPIIGGVVSIVSTFLILRLVNDFTPLSIYAVNLTTGLGLGLAIDYSLFTVSRYREELAAGGDTNQALRVTMETAGRTVMFSSITVAVALSTLFVFPEPFLYSMGVGGVAAALLSGLTASVVVPALLAVLGPRVDALAPPPLRHLTERRARPDQKGFWYRLSRAVMKHPAYVATASAAVLIVLGAPFLGIKFTGIDSGSLPPSASARQASDAMASRFPLDMQAPIYVAITAPPAAGREVANYAARVRGIARGAAVTSPQPLGHSTWTFNVIPTQAAFSAPTKQLVTSIRTLRPPFGVLVGGVTANFLDLQANLGSLLPLAMAILAITTLLIIFVMTGSLLLPIKSLLMNCLTVSAAFGLIVVIFQAGRFEGILRYTSQGAFESTQPILLAVITFALSTDYAVYLLNRIQETYQSGVSNTEAVAHGLERTGRLVTAAALMFCVAVGAFATSKIVFIKELGVGMAFAVIIDASIVRGLLVPALMKMLGPWNWWAPRPLRRLRFHRP